MIEFIKRWALLKRFKWQLKNPLGVHGRIMHKCPGTKNKCKWVLQENTAKRVCDTCGAEDWIFTNPYPAVGEPASEWRRMQ